MLASLVLSYVQHQWYLDILVHGFWVYCSFEEGFKMESRNPLKVKVYVFVELTPFLCMSLIFFMKVFVVNL